MGRGLRFGLLCAAVSVVGGVYAMWPTFCPSVCVNKVVGRLFVGQFVYCHQHSQTHMLNVYQRHFLFRPLFGLPKTFFVHGLVMLPFPFPLPQNFFAIRRAVECAF